MPVTWVDNGAPALSAANLNIMQGEITTALWSAAALSTKTASYTLTASDKVVLFNGTSLTATLPDPTTALKRVYNIKNINASALTVVSAGTSATIDGAATQSVPQNGVLTAISDGTAWFTLSTGTGSAGATQNLAGTYASRPAANTVSVGTVYYATDVLEQYRSDGTAWAVQGAGGNELAYASISTDFTTSATSSAKVDITGLSVTFIAGERPVEIIFAGLLVGTASYVALVLDGTTRAETGGQIPNGFQSYQRSARVGGLTPGSTHTFKATVGGSGPQTVSGASINPAWISVVNR